MNESPSQPIAIGLGLLGTNTWRKRNMRKLLVVFAALTISAAAILVSGPAGAITGNYEKDFVHDYVGLLVFYKAPDPQTGDTFSHRCTGTLISSTVVVTAGHCTEGVETGRAYFAQAPAPNYDDMAFGGLGGDPTTGYPIKNGIIFSRTDNYGFHDSQGYPYSGDLGVVVLDTPYTPPSGLFGLLPGPGAVDKYIQTAVRKQDISFVTSGYGLTDMEPRPVSFRERLMAWNYLVEDKTALSPSNIKTTANPGQGKGGTCFGDSGGPVFFQGTRVVAGVNSFVRNGECKGLSWAYRLDRPELLGWILDPNRVDAG